MAKALRKPQLVFLIAHSFVVADEVCLVDPHERQIVPNSARMMTITRIKPSPPLG
jgi:hypothetical protein